MGGWAWEEGLTMLLDVGRRMEKVWGWLVWCGPRNEGDCFGRGVLPWLDAHCECVRLAKSSATRGRPLLKILKSTFATTLCNGFCSWNLMGLNERLKWLDLNSVCTRGVIINERKRNSYWVVEGVTYETMEYFYSYLQNDGIFWFGGNIEYWFANRARF
jgi:hypothetical protein